MNADSKIGQATTCPICGYIFSSESTYFTVNSHIDSCVGDPSKAMRYQQKLRVMQEDEKSGAASYAHHQEIIKLSAETIRNHEFSDKNIWFRNKIEEKRVPFVEGFISIDLDKEFLFDECFEQFPNLDLRKELKVTFSEGDNHAIDAGGPSREFFTIMGKEILNAERGLLRVADAKQFSFVIDERTNSEQSFQMFQFIGRLFAKAIFDNIPINLCLNRVIYKFLLGKSIELEDIKDFDLNIYNSLVYIRDNSIDSEDLIEEYFTYNKQEIGGFTSEVEMIPGGASVRVKDANKHQFISLKVQHMTHTIVAPQLEGLKNGLTSLLPFQWLSIFEPEELEQVLCGSPKIDLDDWRENTVYQKPYYEGHKIIKQFWTVMEQYDQEALGRVLQFSTGTSRVPLGGFKNLESSRGERSKYTIQYVKCRNQEKEFIKAHTCFNRLDLPAYGDFEQLKEALDYIARNEILGFALEEE